MSEALTLRRPEGFSAKHRERGIATKPQMRRAHLLGDGLIIEPQYHGLELQRIRQSLGISGYDMALALSVPQTSISNAECGDPNFYDLRRREQAWLRQYILDRWPRMNQR